jgi:hypothetical protein
VAVLALSGLVLASLLATSAVLKLRGAGVGRDVAMTSALASFISEPRLLTVTWRAIVGSEFAVALVLVVMPHRTAGLLAALFFVCAAAYAAAARAFAPELPCGCFGATTARGSWWTASRALVLAAIATGYSLSETWIDAVKEPSAWLGVLFVVVATLALSPELMVRRRLSTRRSRSCAHAQISMHRALEILRRTNSWETTKLLRQEETPSAIWREGCDLYMSFEAHIDERLATAVYVLNLPPGRASCGAFVRRGLTGDVLFATADERIKWSSTEQLRALVRAAV